MSEFKPGDEVLLRVNVDHVDLDGDVRITFHDWEKQLAYKFVEPSQLVTPMSDADRAVVEQVKEMRKDEYWWPSESSAWPLQLKTLLALADTAIAEDEERRRRTPDEVVEAVVRPVLDDFSVVLSPTPGDSRLIRAITKALKANPDALRALLEEAEGEQ